MSKVIGALIGDTGQQGEIHPIPQYSLGKILGIWAVAAIRMGILGWIVTPALAHDPAKPGFECTNPGVFSVLLSRVPSFSPFAPDGFAALGLGSSPILGKAFTLRSCSLASSSAWRKKGDFRSLRASLH
jgi:hypothetical protein